MKTFPPELLRAAKAKQATKECCPSCGRPEGVPLAWGDPDDETRKAAQRGELVLAGCMIQPLGGAAPDYACLHCCHRWISQDDPAG